MSRLSLVAEFDDLVRSRTVLTAGIETEFLEFLTNQELCRKQWLEADQQCAELTAQCNELQYENEALNTKLKHARSQIEHEMNKRKHIEQERDSYERQISVVRELLNDKNRTLLDDKDRERLAFLSTDFLASPCDADVKRNLTTIDESGSMLYPSDISFDNTEDDLDGDHVPRSTKRPPASADDDYDDDDGDIQPAGKRSRRTPGRGKKSHRRSNSVDVAVVSTQPGDDSPADTDEFHRSRRYSTPSRARAESTGDLNNIGEEGGAFGDVRGSKRTGSNKSLSSGLTMKRCGSGNSLNKLHVFQSKNLYKHELCSACGKKPRFGSKVLKCKECRIIAHIECRDVSPLPCIPLPVTPTKNPSSGVIADYVSTTEAPMIPALVIRCVEEVNARGWNEEGIYRVPGSDKEVKDLKEKFLRGKCLPNLALVHDIHVICGCLKDFLRSLKEPLVTFRLWHAFTSAVEKTDELSSSSELYGAISELPQPNRDTLAYLILHLHRVSENAACKMTVDNLATVFGPTVVGYSSAEPTMNHIMVQTKLQQLVMKRLMDIPLEFWWRFVNVDDDDCNDDMDMPPPAADSHAGPGIRYLPKYDRPPSSSSSTAAGKAHAGQSFFGSAASSSTRKSAKKNYFDSPHLK